MSHVTEHVPWHMVGYHVLNKIGIFLWMICVLVFFFASIANKLETRNSCYIFIYVFSSIIALIEEKTFQTCFRIFMF